LAVAWDGGEVWAARTARQLSPWGRRSALVTAALALSACAGFQPPPAEPPNGTVRVAPNLLLVLPEPASLGRDLRATQLVAARYGETTFVFEAQLRAAGGRFDLVALDALGRKVMTILWTASGVTAEKAPFLPEALRPENILADIVMLFWPVSVVRRALAASGGSVELEARSRTVLRNGAPAILALYEAAGNAEPAARPWAGTGGVRVRYRNEPWDYALDIQSRVVPS